MNKGKHIVTNKSERPARMDGTCFYCDTPIGKEHKAGCVMREKSVVVKFEIELVMSMPEDWDKDMIEFSKNESSWCASNLITYLQALQARKGSDCLCGYVVAEFVREATEADHQDQSFQFDEP